MKTMNLSKMTFLLNALSIVGVVVLLGIFIIIIQLVQEVEIEHNGKVNLTNNAQRFINGSAYLTNEVRAYSATGDIVHFDDYMNEVVNLKNRGIAIENMNNIGITKEEKSVIKEMSDLSNYLVPLEESAMNNVKKEEMEAALSFVYGKEYTEALAKIRELQAQFLNMLATRTGNTIEDINNENSMWQKIMLIFLFGIIILQIINFVVVKKRILKPLEEFQRGLDSFFDYLNKKTKTVEVIVIHANDELGKMAKAVNVNIADIQKSLEEDKVLINELIEVIGDFQNGDLSKRLFKNVSNPVLTQLKGLLNTMAETLETNVGGMLNIIKEYSKYNYLNKVETTGLQNQLLELANGVNTLGASITGMLVDNKTKGMTLQKSSNVLLNNVDKLNKSSTEAAANLEETAAALEEVTSNIRSNTHNIQKMSDLSSNLTASAKNGEKLANDTTSAMEEIDSQVSSINEAIAVIDQIAFQTNILSLNAAVEAATAGEAGKGFAVVAAEVRNLATRSADAAKEIKALVEYASNKTNDGKSIAADMINGYKELNESISHTVELIKSIENSSKEQLIGIEQINNAVSSLDIQIQENANISSMTKEVAISTDDIANLVVSDANSKEFEGKDKISL